MKLILLFILLTISTKDFDSETVFGIRLMPLKQPKENPDAPDDHDFLKTYTPNPIKYFQKEAN